MTVEYAKSALKGLKKLATRDAEALMAKIDAYAAAPAASHPWAKPLTGADGVRIRQGDYRAVCRIERDRMIVAVIAVGHRKEIYR